MRKVIIIIVLATLMLATGCNQILQVSIILPSFLVPYYEWLTNFPGLQTDPEETDPTEIWKEYNLSIYINQFR